ncbi:MAG: helix-turn-helix transcriptional regulator [Gemmatimonadetes bacterium]|nr:helix-turn-helix transcriptional regulator [Gemmatimonadota bacterium]
MLSEALRLIRVFHDVKQNELAVRLGISNSYLSEIESGKKAPSVEIIEKYASEFQIPASSILFFSEQLGDLSSGHDMADKVRGAIARKVINFLNIVEARTDGNVEEAL